MLSKPMITREHVIALIQSQQARNYAAYQSHRTRTASSHHQRRKRLQSVEVSL
jgi:hypothetical protein